MANKSKPKISVAEKSDDPHAQIMHRLDVIQRQLDEIQSRPSAYASLSAAACPVVKQIQSLARQALEWIKQNPIPGASVVLVLGLMFGYMLGK